MGYAATDTPFLLPTPAGAFHAAAESGEDPLRRFMQALFQLPETPDVRSPQLASTGGLGGDTFDLVVRMRELGWLQGLASPRRVPEGPLEKLLPTLLPHLTEGGKTLLADGQGFYVSSHGFPHETAEELSALSADLAALHQRRSGSLNRNLGLSGSAWGLMDAGGQSRLGFWPLFAGKERFVLITAGMPAFNRPQLVDLVWVLHRRYAAPNPA